MENKLLPGIIFTVMISGACTSAKYLPPAGNIGLSEHGSMIKVKRSTGETVKGELIALNNKEMIVLSDSNKVKRIVKGIMVIPLEEVDSYDLKFAKSSKYIWTIPVLSLISISHGAFAVISIPANILITAIVSASHASSFQYDNLEMPYKYLNMFARFPQGIPPGIDIESIK